MAHISSPRNWKAVAGGSLGFYSSLDNIVKLDCQNKTDVVAQAGRGRRISVCSRPGYTTMKVHTCSSTKRCEWQRILTSTSRKFLSEQKSQHLVVGTVPPSTTAPGLCACFSVVNIVWTVLWPLVLFLGFRTMCAQYCISFADVEKAHMNIRDSVHLTPVLTSSILNQIAGRSLFFKCELFQKTGSFKVKLHFVYVFQICFYSPVHYRVAGSKQMSFAVSKSWVPGL